MTVGDEVRNSLDHWSAGEWRPAMWHATKTIEMTASKRYPTTATASSFRLVIRNDLDIFGAMAAPGVDLVSSRFPLPIPTDRPGDRPDIADLLFAVYRYLHVDESEMPAGCQILPHADGTPLIEIANGRLWLRATAAIAMLTIAVFAGENGGQWIPENYFLSWEGNDFRVEDAWGERDQFLAIITETPTPKQTLDFGDAWNAWSPAV